MTGYLARLAARAAGAAPAAGPRLPSRFEGGPVTWPGEEPANAVVPADGHGRRAADRPAAVPTRDETAPRDRGRFLPRTQRGTRPASVTRAPATAVVTPEASADPRAAAAPAAASVIPPREGARTAERPTESGDARPAGEAARPVATAVRPAALAQTAPREQRADTRPAEPDVVHVSIGRVEVRATMAAPAPAPAAEARAPQARQSRPDPLSLHDYLRGGRVR